VDTLALVLVLGTVAPLFAGAVSVKGDFRSDGTCVMRTFPTRLTGDGTNSGRLAAGRTRTCDDCRTGGRVMFEMALTPFWLLAMVIVSFLASPPAPTMSAKRCGRSLRATGGGSCP
jgi:hypothetical protein